MLMMGEAQVKRMMLDRKALQDSLALQRPVSSSILGPTCPAAGAHFPTVYGRRLSAAFYLKRALDDGPHMSSHLSPK